jgi:hypothetical protein
MKIEDIDTVNHLIGELDDMKELTGHAEHADPVECEPFIKLPDDTSISCRVRERPQRTARDFRLRRPFCVACIAWEWRNWKPAAQHHR